MAKCAICEEELTADEITFNTDQYVDSEDWLCADCYGMEYEDIIQKIFSDDEDNTMTEVKELNRRN